MRSGCLGRSDIAEDITRSIIYRPILGDFSYLERDLRSVFQTDSLGSRGGPPRRSLQRARVGVKHYVYPSQRMVTWGIALGGLAIAAWNGLLNPLAPFPGKCSNRDSWRLYYHGDLSANQVDRYCQALESSTQGINEAWLYQSGKSWDTVLFFLTKDDVEKAEVQRAELEQRLGRDLEDEKIRLDFRKGNPERARIWMM